MKLYEQFSTELKDSIEHGYYQPGQKLPSMRDMSAIRGVSISTVQEAYRLLEDTGVVISKPKSGYFVQQIQNTDLLPDISRPEQKPVEVVYWDEVLKLTTTENTHSFMALGSGSPNTNFKTLKPFHRIFADIARKQPQRMYENSKGKGLEHLRVQIARLMQTAGCYSHPDDIVITSGCQEALSLSLKAVTKPGDIVAIDSPSFYGSMQAIQSNNLKVIEIPTHPQTGISLPAFEMALEQWPIKAIQLVPNANNPLGYLMPEDKKKKLLTLASRYNFVIIEDDIWADLAFQKPRPSTIKSFDTEGRVLMCSSFSKTVAPGLRVGWVAAGGYVKLLTHLKFITTLGSATLPQMAMAEFIQQGLYEKHTRYSKQQYQRGRDIMINWVHRYFPIGTKISYPQGGLCLWVEMPEVIDSFELNENLQVFNIGIAPGALFSANGKYKNCLRLNYSAVPNEKIEAAIKIIGDQAKLLLQKE
ncbi:MAG: PLP-dependent aminotransferase family protein [Cocleimonas sp.]